MMRSLFAGVSGLRNHQVRLDVIGNNIANVNTVGYKASRVTFKEAFAQLVQGAQRPAGQANNVGGGTNPIQVGLGMNIGSIDLLFTQGNLENTGVTTDLAIQGDSFFVVSDGVKNYFTRSGNFQLDANGRLVAATNGFVVQGRQADDNGVLTDKITDIVLPFGKRSPARTTTTATIGGNLNAEAVVGEPGSTRETSITIYDEQGGSHELKITFEKTADNQWTYTVDVSGIEDPPPGGGQAIEVFEDEAGTQSIAAGDRIIHFNEDGSLLGAENAAGAAPTALAPGLSEVYVTFTPAGMTAPQTVKLDFGEIGELDGLSQFARPSSAVFRKQDGYTMGELQRISIDKTGTIVGAFTNGTTQTLAQIALGDFNNPSGLIRTGDNMYEVSANSGPAVIGFAGEGSQSQVISGALEMSNVDLAQQFTNMITAQRGFQSNARVISTSDQMMEELVNLKR